MDPIESQERFVKLRRHFNFFGKIEVEKNARFCSNKSNAVFHTVFVKLFAMQVTSLSETEIILTPIQITDFQEQGFICLEQISSSEEIEELRVIFTRLFAEGAGRNEGAQYDMVTRDEEKNATPTLPQLINPVSYEPKLRDTIFRKNALSIAQQLLGPNAKGTFEHAIYKPAGIGAATPWHQDEATRSDDSFHYNQVSIWMPLQPATIENGCLQYIPKTKVSEILPHRSMNNDPKIHSIECAEGFDPADAVPCPLPPGGATVHFGRTLHNAGPNRSDIPRYAYVLAFETPPQPTNFSRNFYWNKNKESANAVRRRKWRKRGGVLIEIGRKFQGGTWKNPDRIWFELRRAANALFRNRK